MAGEGKSRLIAARGKERAWETSEYEKQRKAATDARIKEENAKSLWGTALSLIGGAVFGPIGYIGGKFLGVKGTDLLMRSEDVKIDVPVGKFDVLKYVEYDAANELLAQSDRASDMQDWADIATSSLYAFFLGGGSLKHPKDFSFTKWGGKEGAGLFDWSIGGGGGPSVWSQWTGKVANVDPTIGKKVLDYDLPDYNPLKRLPLPDYEIDFDYNQ